MKTFRRHLEVFPFHVKKKKKEKKKEVILLSWRRKWKPTPVIWRILWTEEPDGLQSIEVSKSQTQLRD